MKKHSAVVAKCLILLARPARLERATYGFEVPKDILIEKKIDFFYLSPKKLKKVLLTSCN